ncbi:hypothetical protein Taro_011193 [Colocasia esculenta]|uniref:Late embryogenesis abundant protein LEA-2 subgroup domain-containing protein n=1 Tax=Colocasia esculenta TaxID=4460 RepID=A0A843U970_COLES|nr:hypothetical protein [Colocasia esculenta]
MAPTPGTGSAILRRRPGASAGILRCVAITALVLIVAVGLAVLIIWFVIRPAPLEYVVDDARARSFNITAGGRLNATFDLTIWTDNRNNKVAVYYDAMEVRVVYDDQAVAWGEVAPFLHRHHNTTEIRVPAVARSAQLGESAAKEMNRERARGKVTVRVEVRARIRFKIASFKSKHYTLRASCSPVDVYFSPSRESGRTECDVEI